MPNSQSAGRRGDKLALALTTAWTAGGAFCFLVAPQTAPVLLILCAAAPVAWHWADTRCEPWHRYLTTVIVLALGAIYLLVNTAWPLSPGSSAGVAVLTLCAAALLAWRWVGTRRLPWHLYSTTIIVLALAAIYLLVNSTWSLSPAWSASVAGLMLAFVAAVDTTAYALRGIRTPALAAMARGFAAGWVLGSVFLCFEVNSGQLVHRLIMTAVPAIRPDVRDLVLEGGQITFLAPYLQNRSMVAVTLLVWSVLLVLGTLARSPRQRLYLSLAILPALVALGLSAHATSKMALIGGGLVLALYWLWPLLTRRLVLASWITATVLVVPVVWLMYAQRLYTWNALPFSTRERIVIWGYTSAQVAKAPVLGAGINTARVLHQRRRAVEGPRAPGSDFRLTTSVHSHNAYLQTWYEAGAVGASFLLGIGVLVLRSLGSYPARVQPYLYATFASCALVGASSFSLWQPWFMASFGMAAVFATLAGELATRYEHFSRRPRQSP